MKSFRIIDAHQHFWDLSMGKHPWLGPNGLQSFRYGDYSLIKRSYLPSDYVRDTAGFNVVKAVHVEAEWDPADPWGETEWLMRLHDQTGFPNAIVGQVWFGRDDVAEVLKRHAACPLMRGVRQKPAAAASPSEFRAGRPGSLADPKFRAGYARLAKHGLHYELQTPWWHLGEAADLARDFSETTIVLNHTGLPADRSAPGVAVWRERMREFAELPNTAVKISGICVPNRKWTADLNREVVLETIRIFGVDRCMLASNFPVDSIWASFEEIYGGFDQITAPLSDGIRRKLFHDNAVKYYRPV